MMPVSEGPVTKWARHVRVRQRRRYGPFQGLRGVRVEDVLQDAHGFMWFATADGGVTRFDGAHFDAVGLGDRLPEATVMAIREVAPQRLALATLGGGVAYYDQGRVRVVGEAEGLPSDDVLGLRRWPDGRLAAMTERGIAWLGERGVSGRMTEAGGQPLGWVYDAIVERGGRMWIASLERGVIDAAGQPMTVQSPDGSIRGIGKPWGFAPDRQGGIWVAAQYSGPYALLFYWRPGAAHAEAVPIPVEQQAGRMVQQGVRHVRIDAEGRVWACHRGVLVGEADADGEMAWQHLPITELSDTRVTFQDREGNVWVGLWGGGVALWDIRSLQRWTTDDGLPDDEVTALADDGRGSVWVGTMSGAARVHEEGVSPVELEPGPNGVLVLSAARDEAGAVWLGSDGGRVFRCRQDDVMRFQVADDDEKVEDLCADGAGGLWAGTSQGRLLRLGQGRPSEAAGGLQMVRCLGRGADGGLWIGAYARRPAVHRYDGEQAQALAAKGMEDVLYVDALCPCPDGKVWIGTGTGLLLFNRATDSVRHFGTEEGLPANAVTALTLDGLGRLWIGTCGGVARYDGHEFRTLRLGDLPEENMVQAMLDDGLGGMWLGTRAGLLQYRPGTVPPGIHIRRVLAQEEVCAPGSLVLPESVPQVRIEFQGIGFRPAGEVMRYTHRLQCEGEAPAVWSRASQEGFAALRDLPPGRYLFEVKAIDFDDLVSPPAGLELTITPDPHRERVRALEEVLSAAGQPLIGHSTAVEGLKQVVERIGATDSAALILGETGTGKGLVARMIHEASQRRGRPFVQVNCGAIATGLVHSELFGHEKGAFTGAVQRRRGVFEAAKGGTLFLDEVGDLSLDAQVSLLHVLERKVVRRVGATKEEEVDVRVLAATNRDLARMVEQGRFREDLLYRLNTFSVTVPPLRERREDIPELATYFSARQAQHLNRPIPRIDDEVLARCTGYDWPGNVRELEHVIQRATVLCDGVIGPEHLLELRRRRVAGAADLAGRYGELPAEERGVIQEALLRANGVVAGEHGAAQLLGLHPQRLRSRMRALGLGREGGETLGRRGAKGPNA